MFVFRIASNEIHVPSWVWRGFVVVVLCAHVACGAAPDGEVINETEDGHLPSGPKVTSSIMTDAGMEDAAAEGAPVRTF